MIHHEGCAKTKNPKARCSTRKACVAINPAPKPTAAERTISLFTGHTDLESKMARDGQQPNADRKRRAPPRKYCWANDGGFGFWDFIKKRTGEEIGGIRWDANKAGKEKPYKAFVCKNEDVNTVIGYFADVISAANAVEEQFK